jgi:hypothetical protein
VRQALDAMERKLARSREMLGELDAWVSTGRASPIADRYVKLITSNDPVDERRLDREFHEAPACGLEIAAALGWSVGFDLRVDAKLVLESMIEETDENGNNEYRYLTSGTEAERRGA